MRVHNAERRNDASFEAALGTTTRAQIAVAIRLACVLRCIRPNAMLALER